MLAVLDLARAEALVLTPLSYLSDSCSWSWQGVGRKVGVTKLEPLYAAHDTHGIITNIMWCRTIVRTVISECLSRIPRISGFVDEGDIIRGEKQNSYNSICNKQFRDWNPLVCRMVDGGCW